MDAFGCHSNGNGWAFNELNSAPSQFSLSGEHGQGDRVVGETEQWENVAFIKKLARS